MPKPDNYRPGDDSQNCASCIHFDDGYCDLYKTEVDPTMVSDGFEPVAERESYSMSELFFDNDAVETKDNLVWKQILRTGAWKLTPGAEQSPTARPLVVIRDGESQPEAGIISMSDLVSAYEDGAIEHVTVPLSHADKVDENTGFVRGLEIREGDDGEAELWAAKEFTEPEIAEKAKRGTIANTSAGILFNYLNKETGKQYRAALQHVALTNRPWINRLKPFGMSEEAPVASLIPEEEATPLDEKHSTTDGNVLRLNRSMPQVKTVTINFSRSADSAVGGNSCIPPNTPASSLRLSQQKREERLRQKDSPRGGGNMGDTKEAAVKEPEQKEETEIKFSEEAQKLFDEQQAQLTRLQQEAEALRAESRKRSVEDKIEEYKAMGLSEHPGLLKVIREIMLSDDGGAALLLSEESEDGQSKESNLTATQIVERVVDALPKKENKIVLSQQAELVPGDEKPETDTSKELSHEEKVKAAETFLYGEVPATKKEE